MNLSKNLKVAVIGAGSWGTALAALLAEQGFQVKLWVYEAELLNSMLKNKINELYLPSRKLPDTIEFISDPEETVYAVNLLLWVTPTRFLRSTVEKFIPFIPDSSISICASKGIEKDTLLLPSQIITSLIKKMQKNIAVISGPSFASEVAAKKPTAIVLASQNEFIISKLQPLISNDYFRCYSSPDILGVELGAALKNVIALACGIADGLGLGFNSRAALITRGLAEITRLAIKMGALPQTLSGLAGIGDLILTCTSNLSRNYQVGFNIGAGEFDKLQEKYIISKDFVINMKDFKNNQKEKTPNLGLKIAEGIDTALAAVELAKKYQVELPICEEIYKIIYKDKSPRDSLASFMKRELKEEKKF